MGEGGPGISGYAVGLSRSGQDFWIDVQRYRSGAMIGCLMQRFAPRITCAARGAPVTSDNPVLSDVQSHTQLQLGGRSCSPSGKGYPSGQKPASTLSSGSVQITG